MMDVSHGQPEPKRIRTGPAPYPSSSQWHNQPESSRQLPPPGPPTYAQHNTPSPFSRPEPHPSMSSIDRRHSGHSDLPPYDSQDPRRSHSGPAHNYPPQLAGVPLSQRSPFSGPRDSPRQEPMIKRDSSDEPQYGRPPSNPSERHVNPSMQHEGPRAPLYNHPPPPQFDNSLPPPQQRTNSYPPPSPMSAPPPDQYGSYQRPPYPSQHEYQHVNYPQQGTPRPNEVKRKAQRAAQACDSCRTLKAKCDEGRPSCSTCKEKGADCRYRDPPPKQQDKTSADFSDQLGRIEGILAGLRADQNAQMNHTNQRFDKIERTLARGGPISNVSMKREDSHFQHKQEEEEELRHKRPQYQGDPVGEQASHSVYHDKARHGMVHSRSIPVNSFLQENESSYTTPLEEKAPIALPEGATQEEGSEEEDGGDARPQGKPAIPVNHTTGAAHLLRHPAIKDLVKEIVGPGLTYKTERYPMAQESRRGPLRLFGVGEGSDFTPGYETEYTYDRFSDGTPGDTHSDTSSPAPPPLTTEEEEPWKDVLGPSSVDSMPDFRREHVQALVQSYKDKMNNMHPILVHSHLDAMVEMFLKNIPEKAKPGPGFAFSKPGRYPESPGARVKKSPGTDFHLPDGAPFWSPHKPGYPLRTISSAMVLLVLALGQICSYREKLPDVAHYRMQETANSPMVRNGIPSASPIQNSPTLPSPAELHSRSRRTSMEGGIPPAHRGKLRNMNFIPGLDYFAYATDILGNQLGGNKLQYAHANILASLYHGQLGRVLDSHAYLHHASYCLQGILKKKLDRFRKIKSGHGDMTASDNRIVFTFWTCLQLESDIIAELAVPPSGILSFEEDMPYINVKIAEEVDNFDPLVIESYVAQLFLRRHLNDLHGLFYTPGEDRIFSKNHSASSTDKRFSTIVASEDNIKRMDLWANRMAWNAAAGEKSSDILGARLRAKFYGAEVITYRPFILNIMYGAKRGSSDALNDSANLGGLETHFNPNAGAPLVNEDARSAADIDPKAIEYVRKGIRALLHSTCAFHDVIGPTQQRLIVTNVWGTAHAQWGNLLTLQAAYRDPILHPLILEAISANDLGHLIQRTISFLDFTATRNSALAIDSDILKHVAEKLGFITLGTASSFTPKVVIRVPETPGGSAGGGSFTSVHSGERDEGSAGKDVQMREWGVSPD